MDKVVVSLGGSVLIQDEGDTEFLKNIASMLASLLDEYEMIIVCGGGKIARYYIGSGRELGADERDLDQMGIQVTRLNARLLQMALGKKVGGEMPRTPEEAVELIGAGKIVVMGGLEPGQTTDAVAAMVAKAWRADRIVNATSVDAVYSEDPKKVSDAKRYTWLTFEEFYRIVDRGGHGAGQTAVFDRKGARIAMEMRIPLFIVYGRDLEELRSAISGGDIRGTRVL